MVPFWVLALALRLAVAPSNGFFGDIVPYQTWAVGAERMQLSAGIEPAECNYPPVYPILLRGMGLLDRAGLLPGELARPVSDVRERATRVTLVVMKMPAIVVDLWAMWMLVSIGATVRAAGRGLVAAGLYAVSPAIIYDSAVWGQTDTIVAALLIWAVLAAVRGQPARLGAAMTLSVLMKLQAGPALLPIAAAMIVLRRDVRWRRIGLGAVVAAVVVAIASYLCGVGAQWTRGFVTAVGYYARSSNGAMNIWWLFEPNASDGVAVVAVMSRRTLGIAMFAAAGGVILWRWVRLECRRDLLAATMAALAMAFFVLPTEIHERYSIPVIGLLAAASVFDVRALWVAGLMSVTVMLNMANESPLYLPCWSAMARAVNWIAWPSMENAQTAIAVTHVVLLGVVMLLACGHRRTHRAPGAAVSMS